MYKYYCTKCELVCELLSFFPSYCLLSSFKAVVEDEAEVAGEKGNLETDVDITSSKQSLASAAEVKVDVAETQYA